MIVSQSSFYVEKNTEVCYFIHNLSKINKFHKFLPVRIKISKNLGVKVALLN